MSDMPRANSVAFTTRGFRRRERYDAWRRVAVRCDPFDNRPRRARSADKVLFVVSLADEMVSERGRTNNSSSTCPQQFPDLAPVLDGARGAVVTGPYGTMLGEFLELLDRNLPQSTRRTRPR